MKKPSKNSLPAAPSIHLVLFAFLLMMIGCASTPYEGHGPNFALKNQNEIQMELTNFSLEYGFFRGLRMGGKKYERESLEQLIERVSPDSFKLYLIEGPETGVDAYNDFLRHQFGYSSKENTSVPR
jgi:hypothetical protein